MTPGGFDPVTAHEIISAAEWNSRRNTMREVERPLLATNKTPFPIAWRLIDRRMQALRKAGRLVYCKPAENGGPRWRIVDA